MQHQVTLTDDSSRVFVSFEAHLVADGCFPNYVVERTIQVSKYQLSRSGHVVFLRKLSGVITFLFRGLWEFSRNQTGFKPQFLQAGRRRKLSGWP